MTIHKIKDEFLVKAGFAELFAPLDGIACAGVTASKNGADTKTDPVASLGYQAALLAYEMRTELSFKRLEADKAAFEITEFLNAARDVLAAHGKTVLSLPKGATGGTLNDVVSHIDEILTREDMGADRPAVNFVHGNLQGKFDAAYMPKARKEDGVEPEYEGEDEEVAAEPAAKKAPARRGRKKGYAWTGRAPALV